MSDDFVCGICGQTHLGLTKDRAYTMPDEVWGLSEAERATRAKYDTDLCRLDDRHFIRCILPVPLIDQQEAFWWGAWAEVTEETFYRYIELYNVDGSMEPPHEASLANALAPYGDTIGLPVLMQFGDPTKRPVLSTLPIDQSLLAQEQRRGIGDERYHQIVAQFST